MFILKKTYQVVKLGVWSVYSIWTLEKINIQWLHVDGIILSCVNIWNKYGLRNIFMAF
jgi:hypothetical protein